MSWVRVYLFLFFGYKIGYGDIKVTGCDRLNIFYTDLDMISPFNQ